jgi:hypothetical protein
LRIVPSGLRLAAITFPVPEVEVDIAAEEEASRVGFL